MDSMTLINVGYFGRDLKTRDTLNSKKYKGSNLKPKRWIQVQASDEVSWTDVSLCSERCPGRQTVCGLKTWNTGVT
jgi:hypothetical protein